MGKTIFLVTGNPGKLRELQAMKPAGLDIQARSIDLPEIQSLQPREIVDDKLRRAYDIVKAPVIVEDVSAGLDNLGGLPGPFFKFFEQALGPTALLQLAKQPGEPVTIICIAGYYDGQRMLMGEGKLTGIVVQPRGQNGFGFDPVIQPTGCSQTLAELTPDQKNAISHRHHAFQNLMDQLTNSSSV